MVGGGEVSKIYRKYAVNKVNTPDNRRRNVRRSLPLIECEAPHVTKGDKRRLYAVPYQVSKKTLTHVALVSSGRVRSSTPTFNPSLKARYSVCPSDMRRLELTLAVAPGGSFLPTGNS